MRLGIDIDHDEDGEGFTITFCPTYTTSCFMRWDRSPRGWNAQGWAPRTPVIAFDDMPTRDISTVARLIIRAYAPLAEADRQVRRDMDEFLARVPELATGFLWRDDEQEVPA